MLASPLRRSELQVPDRAGPSSLSLRCLQEEVLDAVQTRAGAAAGEGHQLVLTLFTVGKGERLLECISAKQPPPPLLMVYY